MSLPSTHADILSSRESDCCVSLNDSSLEVRDGSWCGKSYAANVGMEKRSHVCIYPSHPAPCDWLVTVSACTVQPCLPSTTFTPLTVYKDRQHKCSPKGKALGCPLVEIRGFICTNVIIRNLAFRNPQGNFDAKTCNFVQSLWIVCLQRSNCRFVDVMPFIISSPYQCPRVSAGIWTRCLSFSWPHC